jgi:hypothetical protein
MEAALVRATVLKQSLAGIEGLAADQAREARALIPPHVIEQVEHASRIDWLPMELNVAFTDAVLRVLGPEASRAHWRRESAKLVDSPIMRPVVQGLTSLLKTTPEQLLAFVPRSWGLVYRNVDVQMLPAGPTSRRMVMRALPPSVAGSASWRHSHCAAMEVIFLVGHISGTMETESFDAARGEVVVLASWSAPR